MFPKVDGNHIAIFGKLIVVRALLQIFEWEDYGKKDDGYEGAGRKNLVFSRHIGGTNAVPAS